MTTFPAQARATRRRALEDLFAGTLASDATRLRDEFANASAQSLPGGFVMLATLLVVGGLLSWPSPSPVGAGDGAGRAVESGPQSDDTVILFHGLVAIVDPGVTLPGHVVVTPANGRTTHHLDPSGVPVCDAAMLAAMGPWQLRPEYVVRASGADVLRQALTPDVVALLNLLPPEWAVNLSAAQGELFVAIEQFRPWFARAGKRVDAADYVELGEALDIVDALAAGMRADGARA